MKLKEMTGVHCIFFHPRTPPRSRLIKGIGVIRDTNGKVCKGGTRWDGKGDSTAKVNLRDLSN